MSNIYLASYKATHAGFAGIVNRAIRWATSSKYSHTEVCVGHPFEGEASCISSSGVDGGVRVKRMRLNPEKWDLVHLPWASADGVAERYAEMHGAPYDYWGTARFAVPLIFPVRQHPTAWFCTEACLHVLGISPGTEWRFDPASGHALVLALGGIEVVALSVVGVAIKSRSDDKARAMGYEVPGLVQAMTAPFKKG